MTQEQALQQQIVDAMALIALWNAELIADAATGTQPDFNLDGESDARDAWRANHQKMIAETLKGVLETQKLINALRPYFLATRQVVSGW